MQTGMKPLEVDSELVRKMEKSEKANGFFIAPMTVKFLQVVLSMI